MATAAVAGGIGGAPPGATAAGGVAAASALRPSVAGAGAGAIPGAAAAGGAASVATSAAAGHLSAKIQKALALRLDSQAARDSLKCLSSFLEDNSVQSRRNLRSTIEGESLRLHEEFVDAFSSLEAQVEGLDRLVSSLDAAYNRASGELQRSRSETQVILEKVGSLRKESKLVDRKQQVLSKFLGRFRVAEADTQLLKSGDRAIDSEFFAAFGRLEQVRGNARQMLSTCGQQTSGVDILHETSELLEASYERMFVWVGQQCKGQQAVEMARQRPQELATPTGAVLKQALALLSARPVYFNHCVRDIARVRRQALVRRFTEALSPTGGDGGRPIELHAREPERYVGDMLAWIHQNVASERDAIAALVGHTASSSDPAGGAAASGAGAQATAAAGAGGALDAAADGGALSLVSFEDIVDTTLEGLVGPFGNRVRQALESQVAIVVVYKVAEVLALFARTLREVLHRSDSCLVVMCRDLHAKTLQNFLDMWEAQSQRLRQGVSGVYVTDLSAPAFVVEAVNTLTEVLAIYEAALVPDEEREADFLPILSAAFDPLLNHCQQVAAGMDPADGQVLLINCVALMRAPLQKHGFTAQRVAMYDAFLEDQQRRLVDGQAASVLAKLGISERLTALRAKPAGTPVSSVPELHAVPLAETLRSFYNSLFTLGGALALPLLERLTDRGLSAAARKGVAARVADAYEELYAGIKELGVATHTPEQVRTLLE
eukprot:TRINITY_DN21604_c0_g2_i1.p1 TRINITY_DN21604_c0_g2~~TRINITY_DN21604_c0_g2_i1.p1  ORF type:complete len:730 (-),score=195.98 TRINITY_DN21604_c0_g2_i1:185-2344(-)